MIRTQSRLRGLLAPALTSILALTGAVGCDDPAATDAGTTPDTGVAVDTGVETPDSGEAPDSGVEPDAGTMDAEVDAGTEDAGTPGVDIRVPDLTGPVEVRFDEDGVLHLRCQTDADCFAVEGYFHAAHRFGQMDFRRRAARGRLAELYGAATLGTDRTLRSFIATKDGARLEEQLLAGSDADTRAAIQAYTRGVNAWIADLRAGRNGAQLTQENALFRAAIADWEELDTAACALVLVASLTNSSGRETAAGQIFSTMDTAQAFDIFGLKPASPSTILPRPLLIHDDARIQAGLERVQARLQYARSALANVPKMPDLGIGAGGDYGSNNWVVAPSQTAGGAALLANDPHLGFSNPSVWYLVSIDSKTAGTGTIHVAGSSFAGLPGILIGQNEDLAWGMTTTFFDMSDVYIETLTPDGNGVFFEKGTVPFTTRDFTFHVAGGADVTETFLYVPHHGPVVSIDRANSTAVTIRWTGQDADTDLDFIIGLARAQTVEEARTGTLRHVTTIGQNFVLADKGGNIAWLPYNRMPGRPWASSELPPWLPLPGDGSAEWTGTVAYDDLPQTVNPVEGWVATANNDMSGAMQDGDPTNDGNLWFQGFMHPGYRHERILEILEASPGAHTTDTMVAGQADVHSLLGERIVPRVLQEMDDKGVNLSADGHLLVEALRAWQFTCPTGLVDRDPASAKSADATEAAESAGCTAFHVLLPELLERTFDDEIQAAGVAAIQPHARVDVLVQLMAAPWNLLAGEGYWEDVSTPNDNEDAATIIAAAVEGAASWITTNVGPRVDDWRWGRIHTITLAADVFDAAGITRYNNGPWANDGGNYTVDVASPVLMESGGAHARDFKHPSGPSMRFVCEVGASGPRCTTQLPGGQRNRPGEPHYEDLFLKWLRNEPIPLRFLPAEIDAAAQEMLTVQAP
ncbi:MAG: penicillin acylase family protein [Myxococcales bacterium]|nr:penicillin acylase family protein [Myxococcales bacterium]MCB9651514.1 penicillin acylase family protein [Deltaproteobacteria bacterium]